MKIAACLTSKSEHYCSPPRIIVPTRRLLVPAGSGRTLLDPWSNEASQTGAKLVCDGVRIDGHTARWTDADTSIENPPYGEKIEDCIQTSHHWHVGAGMPGIWLGPARTDTRWMQGGTRSGKRVIGIHESCDAWVEIKGRLTFWRPIAIKAKDAPPPEKKGGEKYYLQKWWPTASNDNLPAGFRLIRKGLAVGPEVAGPPGKPARPQAAPFPSIVGFWADQAGRYGRREDGAEHPIDIKEFAKHFRHLGTLYVRTGDHSVAYPRRVK